MVCWPFSRINVVIPRYSVGRGMGKGRPCGRRVRRSMSILPQNAMYNPEPTRPWRSCADLFWWDMAFFSPSSLLHISRWKDFQGSQIDNPRTYRK